MPECTIEKYVPFPGLEGVVFECLRGKFANYVVKPHENILYEILVDENLHFDPPDARSPLRGVGAFQTDVLVARSEEPQTPLVVIEVTANLTTDKILTTTAKAAKHKSVYPYLRYGMAFAFENSPVIPGRFFTHNSVLDFAISMEAPDGNRLPDCDKLVVIVERQIAVAEYLIKLMNGSNRVLLTRAASS